MEAIIVFKSNTNCKTTIYTREKRFLRCELYIRRIGIWYHYRFGTDGLLFWPFGQSSADVYDKAQSDDNTTEVIFLQHIRHVLPTWKPLMIPTCNEFTRLITGVDIGFTFNPIHLFKKLLKYDSIRNYHIVDRGNHYNGLRKI